MENYKKILIKRMILMLSIFVFMITLLIILAINYGNTSHIIYYLCGMVFGTSIIFIKIVIKNYNLMKNEVKLKEQYVIEMDERNILIGQKVESLTFKLFVFVIAILSLVYAAIDQETSMLLAWLLALALFIKVGLYLFYKKKL